MCDINPDKFEKNRTRLIVGGYLMYYSLVLSTPSATVTTTKCILNRIIFTINATFLTAESEHL